MHPTALAQLLGNIDIYWLDQILKGRLQPDMRILDAGCGSGRNIEYLLRVGFEVVGIDQSQEAIEYLHNKLSEVLPQVPLSQFEVGEVSQMPYKDHSFDWVVSSAVLHFAQNHAHFEAMVNEMIRVLKPGGILFARLASDIGISHLVQPLENGWYHLPDGSNRFLATELQLVELTQKLGANLVEPIKTTNVQNLRAMTTWVTQKTIQF